MDDLSAENRHAIDQHMSALCGSGPVAAGARYHLQAGGNRVRARMGFQAAQTLSVPTPVALACACGPELLHNASLVHDDLQDRDPVRRDAPAVWKRFGTAAAISIGDLMISSAYASLAAHSDPNRAILLAHDALARTARGQARDLQREGRSVSEYRSMVAEKTGPLLALPVRLALAARGLDGDAAAVTCGDALAFAYQALDDMTDREADQLSSRPNLCALLGPAGNAVARAEAEARDALALARETASAMPEGSGLPFCSLADSMAIQLTELSHAA